MRQPKGYWKTYRRRTKQTHPFMIATYLPDDLNAKVETTKGNNVHKAAYIKQIVVSFFKKSDLDEVIPHEKGQKFCNPCIIYPRPSEYKMIQKKLRGQKASTALRFIVKKHFETLIMFFLSIYIFV